MSQNLLKQAKNAALNLGSLKESGSRKNSVGQRNKSDLFQFSLTNRSSFSASLNNLKANADLKLLNGSRAEIATSTNRGKKSEQIALTLEPGTYYLRVNIAKGGATPFVLSYTATPSPAAVAPPISPPPASTNASGGRTGVVDYFGLQVQAQAAISDFYNNGNLTSFNRLTAIKQVLLDLGRQGDEVALSYYSTILEFETVEQFSIVLAQSVR